MYASVVSLFDLRMVAAFGFPGAASAPFRKRYALTQHAKRRRGLGRTNKRAFLLSRMFDERDGWRKRFDFINQGEFFSFFGLKTRLKILFVSSSFLLSFLCSIFFKVFEELRRLFVVPADELKQRVRAKLRPAKRNQSSTHNMHTGTVSKYFIFNSKLFYSSNLRLLYNSRRIRSRVKKNRFYFGASEGRSKPLSHQTR